MSSPRAVSLFPIILLLLLCPFCSRDQRGRGESAQDCETILGHLSGLEGFEVKDKISVYSPQNLHDYVDGGAEFYLKNDFVKLATAVVVSKQTGSEISVEIYQMQNPSCAQLVYQTERGELPENLKVGEGGYLSGSYAEFVKDEFLVKLIGLGSKESEVDEVTTLAGFVAGAIPP
jgi:hypothetical protein